MLAIPCVVIFHPATSPVVVFRQIKSRVPSPSVSPTPAISPFQRNPTGYVPRIRLIQAHHFPARHIARAHIPEDEIAHADVS